MTVMNISTRSTISHKRTLRIAHSFWFLLAAALLLIPPSFLAALLLAAALHECGHILLLRLCRVPIISLRMGASGAVIEAPGLLRLSYGRELLVTLAGPAANLLCARLSAAAANHFDWRWGYLFAGASAVLGLYNLLPIPPLDGSRALYLLIAYHFGPLAGDTTASITGAVFALALFALGAYCTFAAGGGTFFLLAAALLLTHTFWPTRLAKQIH